MNSEIQNKIEELKFKITPLLRKYPITKAGFFGSILRKEFEKANDIDILVEFKENSKLSLFDLISIENEMKKILGKDVDMVQYKSIKPALKEYILPTEIRIYEENS